MEDDDMWAVSSSGSKYQSGSYRFVNGDFEEEEEEEEDDDDDEIAVDYPCPFCSDDYDDLLELCHHIDEEHQLQANHGICPVCSKRVKMHMVDHITTHHRVKLYGEQKQTSYMEDPYSTSDKYLHSLLDELPPSSNHHHTSKSVVSDQFLSFIDNSRLPNQTKIVQPVSSVEDKNQVKDSSSTEKDLSTLSNSEQLEKAKKSEFVKELLSSAMFDDNCDLFFFFL
ncbi:unnamed protein product [Cochlearia groenlandica]